MSDQRLENFTWDSPEERGRQLGKEAAMAFQNCLAARDSQNWEEALLLAERLDTTLEALDGLHPEKASLLWSDYAQALASLTGRLHGLLALNSPSPLPEPDRSNLCWQLTVLLDRLLIRPTRGPAWLDVVHTQLLLHGAIYWRNRLRQPTPGDPDESEVKRRTTRLFARAAARLDPLPVWVSQACDELGVSPMVDPQVVAREPTDVPDKVKDVSPSGTQALENGVGEAFVAQESPAALSVEVDHYLLNTTGCEELKVALTCSPGERLLIGEGSRLELNLAALLELESGEDNSDWIVAIHAPLKRAIEQGKVSRVELLEPISTVLSSLSLHWKLGGRLQLFELRNAAELVVAWNCLPDLNSVPSHPKSSNQSSADSPLAPLQICLDPIELAALVACEREESLLPEVLARFRREYRHESFWNAPIDEISLQETAALECLRLLQRDGGFYAASLDPMGCLERWRQDSFDCLQVASLWTPESGDEVFSLLAIAQELCLKTSQPPCLCIRPEPFALHGHMANREVLVVTWSSEHVLAQHQSGKAFRLFLDRQIQPYGLRVISPPDSRHPHRPHTGFCESLDTLIRAIESEHDRRAIDLVLIENSAYRLPLLSAVHRRGIPAIGVGPEILQLFGIDRLGQSRWHEGSRDAAMWVLT